MHARCRIDKGLHNFLKGLQVMRPHQLDAASFSLDTRMRAMQSLTAYPSGYDGGCYKPVVLARFWEVIHRGSGQNSAVAAMAGWELTRAAQGHTPHTIVPTLSQTQECKLQRFHTSGCTF